MNSDALLWLWDAPQKNIHCKPPVTFLLDKLEEFANKYLYPQNILRAINESY